MSRTWYGSYQNRLMENNHCCLEIKVGTGMTEYGWSDREAYEVIEVRDQKHVLVRLLDHKHIGDGCMDNSWELVSNENNPVYYMTKRGNYWYYTTTLTLEDYAEMPEIINGLPKEVAVALGGFDLEKIREKGKQTTYRRANVSFGRASYYFDYEF